MLIVNEITGIPGTPFTVAPGNTATTILSHDTDMMLNSDKKLCTSILLTSRAQTARFAWGTNPTQGASGIGHDIAAGESVRVANPESIRDMRIVDAANNVVSVVNVTPEYSPG